MIWGLVVLIGAVPIVPQAAPVAPLTVYVCPAIVKTPEGFVEPVPTFIHDSVRDIQGQLRKHRGLSVARDEASATVVLRVVARGAMAEPNGGTWARMIGQSLYAFPTYTRTNVLVASLEVGDFKKELRVDVEDRLDGTWRTAAERLTKQAVDWMNANRERLQTHATPR